MNKCEKIIREQLIYFFEKDTEVLKFIEELSSVGELLFFGGSIRDIYLSPYNPPIPRDFDIAIKIANEDDFNSIIEKYEYDKNRFNGYKLKISNMEFDIWDLKNTWAFKHTNLLPSEENLAKSVYLNIDGIVYNFNTSKLYDEILKTSIKNCELDIILEENPQIELNLLRALIFREKYKLDFSKKLMNVFRDYTKSGEDNLIKNLYELQRLHYKDNNLSKQDIRRKLYNI